jgi:hypothetical protein
VLKPAREILGEMADKLDTTMAEEQQQSLAPESDEETDWYGNTLRRHSPEAIQQAIAKAIMELTGKAYQPRIMRLDFAPKWAGMNPAGTNSVEILLRVTPPPWRPSAEDDKMF